MSCVKKCFENEQGLFGSWSLALKGSSMKWVSCSAGADLTCSSAYVTAAVLRDVIKVLPDYIHIPSSSSSSSSTTTTETTTAAAAVKTEYKPSRHVLSSVGGASQWVFLGWPTFILSVEVYAYTNLGMCVLCIPNKYSVHWHLQFAVI